MLPTLSTGSIVIRISKKDWPKAFRPLIAFGPIHAFKLRPKDKDPVYAVSPIHLQLLDAIDIPFEVIPRQSRSQIRSKSRRSKRSNPADTKRKARSRVKRPRGV
jgi:hypothetical protein